MAYEVKHGPDQKALKERLETATACLERFKALKAKQALNIKIYDRTGAEVAIAELEKRAEKEIHRWRGAARCGGSLGESDQPYQGSN